MKHIPERMCIVCRKMYPQSELIRIVRENGSNEIKADTEKKLFGRGAYICKSADCINAVRKRKGIERHLKRPVPSGLYELIEGMREK